MDQTFLLKSTTEEKRWVLTWDAFVEELRRVSCLAAPMMVVSVTLYLLQVVSMIMAGHLSELSLSGVSMATSFTNVTGFSLLAGFSGGLETLCGQTYGAEQYKKFGSYTYCAIISLIVVSIPVSVLWTFTDRLLIAVGIDSEISTVACKYAIWLIPALFAFAILQPLLRYFQSQSLIYPILVSTCAALCFHIPLCWALVYKWELGNIGGALAIGVSYWLNVILLVLYMVFSSSCEKTRRLYWDDIFSSINKFFRFAFPSAVMICLEWWTYELVILLAGLLPDPKLQTSVLSICLATATLHYYVQYGIGAAGSTRVSNELGAGNPQAAQVAVQVVLIMSLVEVVTVSLILFFCRHIFGYAFSSEKRVVDYVAELAPLMCLSIIMEGLQAVLSGIARGCGWQHIGAFINLGAYYLVATPLAVVLCFVLHLGSRGLWMGLLIGKTVQALCFASITALTNWQKQATEAKERILGRSLLADNGLA
ncbi:hypothetical protein POPTR_017G120500v4 [Populus trichocarpa]|uniref:Protein DETOXIFICATION n=1 Tax=Populus trichocarpa TaxID=3694 RepID=A0A2K1X6V7_POPTR|nr:protein DETOXIFICATION 3 [Populus trichocarpa]PNS96510.1 hypothetical protein POPTR_017G120500v4 [Populus trichocarpa]|eukprot:XP_006383382.2 protein DETOXIFICATION 3 [Populus trichocarpa]